MGKSLSKEVRELRRRMFYVYLNGALEFPPIREDPMLLEFLKSNKVYEIYLAKAKNHIQLTDDPELSIEGLHMQTLFY